MNLEMLEIVLTELLEEQKKETITNAEMVSIIKRATVKPILIRYGGADKSSFNMDATELNQAALSILRRAREKAFYKGLPIYYVDKGKLVAEYADDHTNVVPTTGPPQKR